jgi:hypothetical protein
MAIAAAGANDSGEMRVSSQWPYRSIASGMISLVDSLAARIECPAGSEFQ